jgi:hypothetical protein
MTGRSQSERRLARLRSEHLITWWKNYPLPEGHRPVTFSQQNHQPRSSNSPFLTPAKNAATSALV